LKALCQYLNLKKTSFKNRNPLIASGFFLFPVSFVTAGEMNIYYNFDNGLSYLVGKDEGCMMKVKETIISLIAGIDGFSGISYKIHVDFFQNRFTVFEWRNKENFQPITNFERKSLGSMEDFKKDIYLMKIWEWEPSYRKEEGIILDGKYWSIKLNTKGKIYESEGMECFPPDWKRFCTAVEKLTGTPFR
jgi:hypothetical protein